MSMKYPVTLAGIEPAIFRFVAQHLNNCATADTSMERNKIPGICESEIIRTGILFKFHIWLHCSEGIQKLVNRWTKCVENNGDFCGNKTLLC